LGLKAKKALASFCRELASNTPSPGGGTASAAAGAMAASLLAMVCGVTARSKKHAKDAPALRKLERRFETLGDDLIALAARDAEAYDKVVVAFRKRRAHDTPDTAKGVETALVHAADVPMLTAKTCIEVLELSQAVARLGSKSASSDVGVAVLLANAGFNGAAMNVQINLEGLKDQARARRTVKSLSALESRASMLARGALERLG
jgi:glutamate formiminotransferase/formiminotetrahydrofolate cyclodeaminase